jgi:hypothetical protein|tara:strand:+ start:3524 stop:3811 length:288 start_codon:yes stop_codon:yes gene_type:complete
MGRPAANKNSEAGMSAIIGMILNEIGGRAVLTPGSVQEFMDQCEDTRHFVDIKTEGSGDLVITSLHEKRDGTIDKTYLGIDYDKEYPRGCLSGLS